MDLKQWLIDYSNDVVNNEIIACKEHKWACMRFLRDVERQGTDDFPYIFDSDRALHFLNWMTLFKHTKGVLAGKRIVPHEIQVFNFGNIYGWIHKDTKLRRFKKAYWQVAKKNAKSQSLSCVGSYEAMALGEPAAQVYCAATKTDQAKIVWSEIEAQLRTSDDLKGKFKVRYGKIEHPKSDSFIKALSKEDGKKGDGVHTQCGIVDEYHLHETSEIYDNLASSMAARTQPLLIVITTAGFNLNNPCYRVEYKYVTRILDPDNPIENDEYFVMINKLDDGDDIRDERNWIKANPILCSYEEGMNFLRGELKLALQVPEKMRNFLTKNMNVWVDKRDNGYIEMNKWTICGKKTLPDLKGLTCIVGVDLSKKIDLTSISFEFYLGDDKYAVLSHSFMPEDTLEEKRNSDRVPYDLWAKQGWITITPGAVVDYNFIKAYIIAQEKENNWSVKEICYDPYNATQFAQDMELEGYTCVEIRQGVRTLSEPTKSFRESVKEDKIYHDNNPVLTWALGNAVTKQDSNENIMLDKAKSTERIDPIASVINSHVRSMLVKNTFDLNDYVKSDDFSF